MKEQEWDRGREPFVDYVWRQVKESNTRLGCIRKINKIFHRYDESDKWPIRGDFDVTERAIRRIRKNFGGALDPLEYIYALDNEISDIVKHYNQ